MTKEVTDSTAITDTIQEAQNGFRQVEEQLTEICEQHADRVRRALEDAEDILEDECGRDRFESGRQHIQSAQDAMNGLQKMSGQGGRDQLEELEEKLELVEDLITDRLLDSADEADSGGPPYEVTVSSETEMIGERFITPSDLLEEFGYEPNDYLLYPGDAEDAIPRGEEIDLSELQCFSAVIDDTGYGEADLDETLEEDIDRLRAEGYEVEVDARAEPQFTHVIIRGYGIPSSNFNRESTDVMIRVHQNYPQKAPDWVYVDPELRLESGELPHKSNPDHVDGWLGLSWHINSIEALEWEPYETDLLWYLNHLVESRLRQVK